MIYIHIPYCRSFCTYCDFYSELPKCGFDAFVKALCAEIGSRAGEISQENNTLYIGGGTPSVLPLSSLESIVAAVRADPGGCADSVPQNDSPRHPALVSRHPALDAGSPFTEFTIEVNPDDIVRRGADYVAGLRALGVNRVSMGVQALDDAVLKWMNRRHDAATAREAYRLLRDGGIDNISVDLIFGYNPACFPHLGEDFWSRTLDEILDIGGDGMPPKHISAYQLSVEDGSALAAMLADGRYAEASEDFCADQYALLCERLAAAGYHHYEISNFALPGYEAVHNSAYWRHVPYVGFGPAAHSLHAQRVGRITPRPAADPEGCAGSAPLRPASPYLDFCEVSKTPMLRLMPPVAPAQYIREWNAADVEAYVAAAQSGDWDSVVEREVLTPEQVAEETIMLALRTDKGIDRRTLEACCSDPSQIDRLLAAGALEPIHSDAESLRIPESHFFVSDDIISDLI